MKRFMLCGITLLLCMTCFSGCSTNTSNHNSNETENIELTQKQKEIITSFVKDLADLNFDALSNNYTYDSKMKSAIQEESFQGQMNTFMTTLGVLNDTKTPYGLLYQGNTSVFLPCIFENNKANIQLTFNTEDEIIGVFIKNYKELDTTNLPDGVSETSLNLPVSKTVSNAGKLIYPSNHNGKLPVAILISGSGPNDMDETIGSNKPFRDIAWNLAKSGIAVYQYDKRTYENANTLPSDFTVQDEYIDDVKTAVDLMKENDIVDPSNVYLLGHSEGAYLIPRIADQIDQIAGYILMGAPARLLEDIFVEQIQYIANLDNTITDKEQATIDAFIQDQQTIKALHEDTPKTMFFGGLPNSYMLDLQGYSPVETAKSMHTNVLVLQGESDYQVTMVDYNKWKDAYGQNANWTFHSYPGLSHIMMEAGTPPSPADYTITSHVSDEVLQDIVSFVNTK